MSLLTNVLCVVDSILSQGRHRGCTLAEIELLTGAADNTASSHDGLISDGGGVNYPNSLSGRRRSESVSVTGSSVSVPAKSQLLVIPERWMHLGRADVAEAVLAALEAGLLERRDEMFHVVEEHGHAGAQGRAKASSRAPTEDVVASEDAIVAEDASQQSCHAIADAQIQRVATTDGEECDVDAEISKSSKRLKTMLGEGLDFGSCHCFPPAANVTEGEGGLFEPREENKSKYILAWMMRGDACNTKPMNDFKLNSNVAITPTTYLQLAKGSGFNTSSSLAKDMLARLNGLLDKNTDINTSDLEQAMAPPRNKQLSDPDLNNTVGSIERHMKNMLLVNGQDNLGSLETTMSSNVDKTLVNDSACNNIGCQEPKKSLTNVCLLNGSGNVASLELKITQAKKRQLAHESLDNPLRRKKNRLTAFTIVNGGSLREVIATKRRRIADRKFLLPKRSALEAGDTRVLLPGRIALMAGDMKFSFPRRTASQNRSLPPTKRTALEQGDAASTLALIGAQSLPLRGVDNEHAAARLPDLSNSAQASLKTEGDIEQVDMKNIDFKFGHDEVGFATSLVERTKLVAKHDNVEELTQFIAEALAEPLVARNEIAEHDWKKRLSVTPVASHQYLPDFEFLEDLQLTVKERAKFDVEGVIALDESNNRFGLYGPRIGDVGYYYHGFEQVDVCSEDQGCDEKSKNDEYEFYS